MLACNHRLDDARRQPHEVEHGKSKSDRMRESKCADHL
jgi:hypothetical protein